MLGIFNVNDSSSFHADICKNNFLVLGYSATADINGRIGAANKSFSINFSKTKTKFCVNLHFNGEYSY